MKKEDLTMVLLVGAAADLNEVLKLKPPIGTEFSSSLKGVALKAAREKFEDQLGKDLIEVGTADLIAEGDVLGQSTVDVLKALGVLEIKAQVASVKELAAAEKGKETKETKEGGEKKLSGKEKAKMTTKKQKVPVKKKGTKEEVKVDLDGYGFPKGSKRSEAVKLMMTGKVSMVDLKKKFGATFYGPLKKLESGGYAVKKDDKGHIVISPPKKR